MITDFLHESIINTNEYYLTAYLLMFTFIVIIFIRKKNAVLINNFEVFPTKPTIKMDGSLVFKGSLVYF